MKRPHCGLLLLLLLTLAGCFTGPGGATPAGRTPGDAPAVTPFPTATNLPAPGAPQVALLTPPLIDEARGRLYAAAQVNSQPALAVLDAANGRLLAAWDVAGQLALDAPRNRLVVDRGPLGLAILDAQTGEERAIIALPPQDAPPAPQIDAATGRIFAFREASVYVIDPAIADVLDIYPLSVTRYVCDVPGGDAPIYRSAFDAAAGQLYLSFISRTCIPWANVTLVAYDAADMTELGHTDLEIRTQYAPHDGRLSGLTVSRLGPSLLWSWDGTGARQDTGKDYLGEPAGVAADPGRERVYHAVSDGAGGQLLLLDGDGQLLRQIALPLLADHSLAGYYAANDTLYFLSPAGRLLLWPAAPLVDAGQAVAPAETPVAAPSPLPAAPVTSLVLSPNWAADGTMVAILADDRCAPAGGQLFIMLDPAVGWQPGIENPGAGAAGACAAVAAAAFSPNYARDSLLFAAVNDPPAVWRSVDGGRSWTAPETPFAPGTTFRALLPSPAYATDQTLFALAHSGELYRSRDGGRRWLALDQPLEALAALDAPGPAYHLVGAWGGELLRSPSGDTWTAAGATPNSEPLVALALAPSALPQPALYAFTTGGRLARSADGGASWSVVMETSPGPAQFAFADGPEATRAVFLLHDGQVVASYDGLASIWASTSADEASRYRPTAIALPPNLAAAPFLFVGTVDGQVLRVRADARP